MGIELVIVITIICTLLLVGITMVIYDYHAHTEPTSKIRKESYLNFGDEKTRFKKIPSKIPKKSENHKDVPNKRRSRIVAIDIEHDILSDYKFNSGTSLLSSPSKYLNSSSTIPVEKPSPAMSSPKIKALQSVSVMKSKFKRKKQMSIRRVGSTGAPRSLPLKRYERNSDQLTNEILQDYYYN